MPVLSFVAQNLWVYETPFNFSGLNCGNRTTIIRLKDGGLWIHSPSAPSPAVFAEVRSLGHIAFLIAPNIMHHLFLEEWKEEFPEVEVWMPKDLAKKIKWNASYRKLGKENEPWSSEIESFFCAGIRMLNEFLFYHGESRTLILVDLVITLQQSNSLMEHLLFKILDINGRAVPDRLVRFFIKDRKLLLESLKDLQKIPIENFIPAHGPIFKGPRAKQAIGELFEFLNK